MDNTPLRQSRDVRPIMMKIKSLRDIKAIHGVLALPFVLLPHAEHYSLTGAWYLIGWPLPSGEFKLGHVVPYDFPFHPHMFGIIIITLPLWTILIFLVDRFLKMLCTKTGFWGEIPKFLIYTVYAGFVVAFGLAVQDLWVAITMTR